MPALRKALLAALLGLMALLIAWRFRRHAGEAPAARSQTVAAGAEAKKPALPPHHDFPRHGPGKDAAFEGNRQDDTEADIEHPWADYLRKCAEVNKKLESVDLAMNDEESDFETMLKLIESRTGMKLNIDVPADLLGKRETIGFDRLKASQALGILVADFQCRFVIDPAGQIWVEPLSEERSVHEPEFADRLRQLRDVSEDVMAGRAREPATPSDLKKYRAMSTIKVSLNFTDTPLPEVADFMQELTQFNIAIDQKSIEDAESKLVTFKVDELAFDQAFDLILKMADLGYEIEEGVIVVRTKEALQAKWQASTEARLKVIRDAERELFGRPVAFGGENLQLREVAEILAKGLGVPYVIDPGIWVSKARFTIEERQRPASDIVALMHKGAAFRIAFRGGILWFLSPDGVK